MISVQGMEGTHKEFKANHTFRTELPLGQFIQMLEQLVKSFTLFGFPPQCVMKCVLKSPATEKAYLQSEHFLDFLQCVLLNGISNNRLTEGIFAFAAFFGSSPLCVIKCVLKSPATEKAYLQSEHFLDFLQCVLLNGISNNRLTEGIFAFAAFFGSSPLCVIKCVLKSPATEKAYLQSEHFFDFLQCLPLNEISNVRLREYIFAFGSSLDFSPRCVFKCLLKLPA